MADAFAYLDSSALLKLVLDEPGSDALRAELKRWPQRVASWLTRTETIRACRHAGPHFIEPAERALLRVSMVPIDLSVLEHAARLEPTALRSLDAIHLATALSLGTDLGAVITYDERLGEAAQQAGLRVLAPA